MELSLNILLDALSDANPLCYTKDKSRTFSGVRLLGKAQDADPGKLVICGLSQALNAPSEYQACVVAAVIDTELPKNAATMQNMVLFDTEMGAVQFFMHVQDVFDRYINWCFDMDQCLIKHRSIQDLLTLSENIIGNFITISDSAFSLVAYTQGLTCDDEITNRLIEKGYHDQDAIRRFGMNNLMNYWKDADDIYVRKTGIVTQYPMMSKVIHYNNSYYSHVVMLCNNRPPTDGLRDLFRILIDHLMTCFERQWLANNQMPHIYDSLLLELLESSDLSPDMVNAKAKNAGLPAKGSFVLVKVSTDENAGIMLQRLCNEISSRVPQSRVTLSNDILIALIIQSGQGKGIQELMELMQEIMDRYNSSCGISDPFTSLMDIKSAGMQAQIALDAKDCGPLKTLALPGKKQFSRVRSFTSCYPGYVFSENTKDISVITNSSEYRALEKLQENDSKRGTNNLKLLYYYLINERKASETAKLLHMHRNNVIYRISKIEEIIKLDLEDPDVRLRLLLCFEIYRPKE